MASRGAERAPLLAGASRAAADDVEGGAQHPAMIRPNHRSKAWTTKLAIGATLVAVGALIGGLTTSRNGASGSSTSLSSWLAGFAAPSSADSRGRRATGTRCENHALDGVFAARYDSNESRDVASQSRGEGDDEGSR
jgi:hypothetical protein